jgi:primosomal protein N'
VNQQPDTPEHLTALREQILARCNDEELRTLCADLGIDYDDLPASGRANKARELVAFLNRQDRTPELEAILARPRPPAAKIRPAQQRALRNRQAMLQLVHNTWVKGVLEQSLHGAALIALGMTEQARAVEHPWDMVLQAPEKPDRNLPPGTQMINTFDEMNQALLILGEPGSGKTTMLLELARDAIARAQADPAQPIPVVFNLSSWAEKRQPLVEWLIVTNGASLRLRRSEGHENRHP